VIFRDKKRTAEGLRPEARKGPRYGEFDAVLERSDDSGAACFIPFPFDLKATYGKGNLVPVQVMYDSHAAYQGSLAYMGGAHALLLVRKDVLSQLGKDAGETVHVRVMLDTTTRVITLPDDARAAIDASASASAFWSTLSYSNQREYLIWIESAKRPETRQSRIEKSVQLLAEGKRLK